MFPGINNPFDIKLVGNYFVLTSLTFLVIQRSKKYDNCKEEYQSASS
jgi:hypothetical protein